MTDTILTKSESWLKQHETIILIVLFILSGLFVGSKILNHIEAKDQRAYNSAQQALNLTQAQNQQLAQQMEKTAEQYKELVTELNANNTRLIQNIQVRDQQTKQQQIVDQTLPLTDIAKRWVELAVLVPGDVQNINGSLAVSDAGARKTVQQLELISDLTKDLEDGKILLADKDKQISAQDGVVAGLNKEIGGLNHQIKDQDASCKADIASINAKARKGKLNWFLRGAGVGGAIVAYIAIHFI